MILMNLQADMSQPARLKRDIADTVEGLFWVVLLFGKQAVFQMNINIYQITKIQIMRKEETRVKYNLKIEKINNGWIFSGYGKDNSKIFFNNLESFGETLVKELRELEKIVSEHGIPDKLFVFNLESDL